MLEFLYNINEYLYVFLEEKGYHHLFSICIIIMILLYVASFTIPSENYENKYTKNAEGVITGHSMTLISFAPLKIILFILASIILIIFPFSCSTHDGDKDNTKLIGNETKIFKVGESITIPNDRTLYKCIKDSSKNAAVFSYLAYRGASEAKEELYYREYVTGPTIKKHWWGDEKLGDYKVIKYICSP